MQSHQLRSQSRSWRVTGLPGVEFLWHRDEVNYPDHVHEGFNIDYVQTGQMEYRIGPRFFLVRPGSFICIDQHSVHSARSLNTSGYAIRTIFFAENFIFGLAAELGINRIPPIRDPVFADPA